MCSHTNKNLDILAMETGQALRIQGYEAVNRAFSVCRTYQGCSFVIHGGDHDGTCTSSDNPPPLANISVVHSQSVFTFLSVSLAVSEFSYFHSIQCRTYYLSINEESNVGLHVTCVYYEYFPKHTSCHVSIALWTLCSLAYDILTTVVKHIYLCCSTITF